MATVQLSDIVDVTVYQDLEPVNNPEKSDLVEAGIIVNDEMLNGLASAAGKLAELPFWNDIDPTDEPNLSSDDPASSATADKVDQGEQISRKAFLNKGLSASNLARELALGDDALQHIRNRFGTYWTRQQQRRLLASSQGVLADNVANDSGDMVHDIASESIAGQSASTRWSEAAFIDAAFTMGDMVDGITAIGMHSMIAKQITEQNGAEDVRDSEGNLLYQAYKNRRMIVDDTLPIVAGSTDGFKYLSILYGPGAWGFGSGSPVKPVAVQEEEAQGDGAGVETLWERKTWITHPFGFQATGTPAATSFTTTELKLAAQWDRVVARKSVPMAFLWTN